MTVQQSVDARDCVVRFDGPIVIDLTGTRPPVVDDEFVVEWQISEPGRRPIDAERVVGASA